jgi:hypothetical protein
MDDMALHEFSNQDSMSNVECPISNFHGFFYRSFTCELPTNMKSTLPCHSLGGSNARNENRHKFIAFPKKRFSLSIIGQESGYQNHFQPDHCLAKLLEAYAHLVCEVLAGFGPLSFSIVGRRRGTTPDQLSGDVASRPCPWQRVAQVKDSYCEVNQPVFQIEFLAFVPRHQSRLLTWTLDIGYWTLDILVCLLFIYRAGLATTIFPNALPSFRDEMRK